MTARRLARSALIGALYALLTVAFAPISAGLVQMRVSEALCVLPFFTPDAAAGLFVGCLIGNIMLGAAWPDVVFGSLATLLAALITQRMRKANLSKWLAPAPAVIVNAIVVGALLAYVYEVGPSYELCAVYVAAGQALACYGLGIPLAYALERFGGKLFD